jgi:hypothetical protein
VFCFLVCLPLSAPSRMADVKDAEPVSAHESVAAVLRISGDVPKRPKRSGVGGLLENPYMLAVASFASLGGILFGYVHSRFWGET